MSSCILIYPNGLMWSNENELSRTSGGEGRLFKGLCQCFLNTLCWCLNDLYLSSTKKKKKNKQTKKPHLAQEELSEISVSSKLLSSAQKCTDNSPLVRDLSEPSP